VQTAQIQHHECGIGLRPSITVQQRDIRCWAAGRERANQSLQPTAYRAACQDVRRTGATGPPSRRLFSAAGQPCRGEVVAPGLRRLVAQYGGG